MVLFKRYSRRARIKVRDVMSSPPITVDAGASILDASRVMFEKGVGSVLVVDSSGRLVGIVTERDLLYAMARGIACRDARVSDIMTRNLITVGPDDDLGIAVERMREMNIRHLPVMDGEGRPLGMVSMRDILDLGMSLLRLMVSPH